MMTVVLKRKISKEIVTTYIPTALLMMITLATILIKPLALLFRSGPRNQPDDNADDADHLHDGDVK